VIEFNAANFALFFMLWQLCWPFIIFCCFSMPYVILVFIINFLLGVLVGIYTSSKVLKYYQGIETICAYYMTGFAEITFLKVVPVLSFIYILLIFYAIIGIFRGRKYTQERFITIVLKVAHIPEDEFTTNIYKGPPKLPDWIRSSKEEDEEK